MHLPPGLAHSKMVFSCRSLLKLLVSIVPCAYAQSCVSLPPPPLKLEASPFWDGLDGPWSTFYMSVGSPPQSIRAVPGLSSPITQLPIPCVIQNDTPFGLAQACLQRNSFRYDDSTTWKVAGVFNIPVSYVYPASNASIGLWGSDIVWIGTNSTRDPRIEGTYVAGVIRPDFLVPVFGLSPGFIRLAGAEQASTIMSNMFALNVIPSTVSAYTAGSAQRQSSSLVTPENLTHSKTGGKRGSLILGGYDRSQLDLGTALSLPMPNSQNFSLIVNVTAISIAGRASLEWTQALFAIDSLLPQIWMSPESCKIFEDAFRLTWDNNLELYTVDSTTHSELLKENTTVTFTISGGPSGGKTVDYLLPYSAFDLTLSPPLVNETTYYFPLKRSKDGFNILGRAFLQEVYLIVDYERSNFTISQAKSSGQEDIIAIFNTTYTPPERTDNGLLLCKNQSIDGTGQAGNSEKGGNSDSALSSSTYAGIAVGAALCASLVAVLLLAWKKGWWVFRKDHSEQNRFDKAELHGTAKPRVEALGTERAELAADEKCQEVTGSQPQVEIAGIHDLHELHSETR